MTHVEKIEIEIMIEFTQDEKDRIKKEQAWLQITISSFLSDFWPMFCPVIPDILLWSLDRKN